MQRVFESLSRPGLMLLGLERLSLMYLMLRMALDRSD